MEISLNTRIKIMATVKTREITGKRDRIALLVNQRIKK